MLTSSAPQIIEHISKNIAYTPYDCKWIPNTARFVVIGISPRAKGVLQIYEMNYGDLTLVSDIEKENGIKCGTFAASNFDDQNLATGDHSGRLNVWNLERIDTPVFSANAHSSLVNCIDGCGGLHIGSGPREIVTGGRDGCVRIWDIRVPDPVLALEPDIQQSARDCWTVAFGNSFDSDERIVASGYDNGDLKLFDMRAGAMRFETNVNSGITCIEFDRKDIEMNKLVLTCLESTIHVYDLRTLHPTKGFAHLSERGHRSTVWNCKHLPQNRDLFVSTGGNGGINLYRYQYPASRVTTSSVDGLNEGVIGSLELLSSKVLSTQPIAGFDFHNDKEGLAVSTALDQTIKVLIITRLNQ